LSCGLLGKVGGSARLLGGCAGTGAELTAGHNRLWPRRCAPMPGIQERAYGGERVVERCGYGAMAARASRVCPGWHERRQGRSKRSGGRTARRAASDVAAAACAVASISRVAVLVIGSSRSVYRVEGSRPSTSSRMASAAARNPAHLSPGVGPGAYRGCVGDVEGRGGGGWLRSR